MKNKEIEELLNKIKNKYEDYYIEDILSDNDLKLLLSYIEQLENNRDKAIEILHSINDNLPLDLILTEIEHSEYILKGDSDE